MNEHQITSYVDETTKIEIEKIADKNDVSESKVIRKLVKAQLQQNHENRLSAQSQAVQNLEKLIHQGTEEMEIVAEDIRDINAKTGVYAVALFELLKQNHSQNEIQQALQTGASRLRDDLDEQIQQQQQDSNENDSNDGSIIDFDRLRDD